MNEGKSLADARKAASNMSQRDLAGRMTDAMSGQEPGNATFTLAYMQKRVSLWETGKLQPAPIEMTVLGDIFGVRREEVESWFQRRPVSAVDLFGELGNATHPCFVAVCYGGKPNTGVNDELFPILLRALSANLSLGMFFPYPMEVEPDLDESDNLTLAYADVLLAVQKRFEALYSHLSAPNRDEHLALYQPKLTGLSNIMLPPHASRFTYIIELLEDGPRPSIYQWVDIGKKTEMYRVGSFSDYDPFPQMRAWRAYFGPVIDQWLGSEGQRLPGSVGIWKRSLSGAQQDALLVANRRNSIDGKSKSPSSE